MVTDDWIALIGGARPERIHVANVTADYFDVLGVKPLYGRFFRPEEEAAGRRHSVCHSQGHYLWKMHFAVVTPGLWASRWRLLTTL